MISEVRGEEGLTRVALAVGAVAFAVSGIFMGCGPKPGAPAAVEVRQAEEEPVLTVEARMELAQAFMDKGRVGDAAGHYLVVLAEDPANFTAHLNLGIALMTMEDGKYENERDYTEAKRHFMAARSIRGGDAAPHKYLGLLAYKTKAFGEAADHLSTAARLKPGDEAVHEMLGVSLVEIGKEAEGVAELIKTLRINPDNETANFTLGKIYEARDDNGPAMKYLERALAANPNLDMAVWILERTYYEQGLDGRAEEACRRFLRFHPDDIQSLEILGWIYKRQGRTQEMLETYTTLTGIAPDDTGYWSPLIQHYMESGDYDKAKGILEDALEHNPYYAYGNIRYGQVLIHYGDQALEAGSRQEALRLFSRAKEHIEKARVDDRYLTAAARLLDQVDARIGAVSE